jgi:nicotinamide riboside kinase
MTPTGGRVVAVLGAESTGKTELAQALAEQLGSLGAGSCTWVAEVLREWCDREGRTPARHEQAAIAVAQRQRIEQAAATQALVVADTTELMTAVYSEQIFEDRSLTDAALRWHAERVDLTLLTGLDLPWQPDGLQRDGPQVREPVDRRLRELLQGHGLPFAVVYGRAEQRGQNALRAMSPLWPDLARQLEAQRLQDGARWRPRCLDCLRPDCEQALHRRAPPTR